MPISCASHRERKWVLVWTLVVLAVSCLPYLVAWITSPAGYSFGGILVNPYDGHSYLAKMRQGWLGSWQFHLVFTPEEHTGEFIFIFYLALGHLARLTGLPLIVVYHLARLLSGFALLTVTYAFICRLTGNIQERRLAFLLAATASGLGWLGVVLGAFPIDLWVPEAFVFFSLLSNPHFPLAMTLMLLIVGSVLWPRGGFWRWLMPGLSTLALAVVQPFAMPPVFLTVAAYLLFKWLLHRPANHIGRQWPWPEMVAAASAVLFSIPVFIYDYLAYTRNPALTAWATQNVTPAPPVLDLVLGLGLVGLIAIPGAYAAIRQRDLTALALAAWAVGTVVLVYLPFPLQRRFITGLGLPLAMLAAIGLARQIGPHLSPSRARLVRFSCVTISAVGSVFLLLVLIVGASTQRQTPSLFYLTRDEQAGMHWLLEQAPGKRVLAAPVTGAWLPGQAGVRTFYGHPFETIEAPVKQAQAEAFFQSQVSEPEWQALKQRYNLDFIFFGPAERKMGLPPVLDSADPVFQQGNVSIYQNP